MEGAAVVPAKAASRICTRHLPEQTEISTSSLKGTAGTARQKTLRQFFMWVGQHSGLGKDFGTLNTTVAPQQLPSHLGAAWHTAAGSWRKEQILNLLRYISFTSSRGTRLRGWSFVLVRLFFKGNWQKFSLCQKRSFLRKRGGFVPIHLPHK